MHAAPCAPGNLGSSRQARSPAGRVTPASGAARCRVADPVDRCSSACNRVSAVMTSQSVLIVQKVPVCETPTRPANPPINWTAERADDRLQSPCTRSRRLAEAAPTAPHRAVPEDPRKPPRPLTPLRSRRHISIEATSSRQLR